MKVCVPVPVHVPIPVLVPVPVPVPVTFYVSVFVPVPPFPHFCLHVGYKHQHSFFLLEHFSIPLTETVIRT